MERCQASLGMEGDDILDSAITVSSRLDSSHTKSSSRLYSSSSWCSSTSSISEYLQVNLGHVKTVTGVATQGDPSSNKWVTKYNILYGYDGKTWVTDALHQGLTGNTDKSSVVVNWFSPPFAAQFVKVVPLTWNTAVCLRVDFYGCDHFIIPFLYIAEFADVTLPTQAVDSSVVLRVQAEFTSQRPAKFSWSNNGNSLSETASAITVKYKSALQTWNNYRCVRRSLTRRDIYCNTTYSCSVSVPDIPGLTKVVEANVTALLTVPRRPSMLQVTQGDINARTTTVRWTQPNPGADEAPIRSFELQYTNQSFTSTLTISSPSIRSKQLTNLKPYTDYRVKMMANSILGNGLWSDTKTFKTSTAEPEVAPHVTSATALSSQSIYIEWQKPDLDKVNGPLTKYIVVYKETGASENMVNIDKSRTSQTLGNLKKWTVYKIQLRVNNGDFNGPLSVENEVRTLQDAPSAPTSLGHSVTPPSDSKGPQVTITWQKPQNENGIITAYNVFYSHSEDPQNVHTQNTGKDTLTYIVDVLGGVTYQFNVRAVTIAPGPNASLSVDIPQYRPSVGPDNVSSLAINSTTFNITWSSLPRDKARGMVTFYEVKQTSLESCITVITARNTTFNSTTRWLVLYDLYFCSQYEVSVRAYTTAGFGPYGSALTIQTLGVGWAQEKPNFASDLTADEDGITAKIKFPRFPSSARYFQVIIIAFPSDFTANIKTPPQSFVPDDLVTYEEAHESSTPAAYVTFQFGGNEFNKHEEFIIGNGIQSNSTTRKRRDSAVHVYSNKPLQLGTNYRVFLRAFTTESMFASSAFVEIDTSDKPVIKGLEIKTTFAVGQLGILTCEVSGNVQASITWTKDGNSSIPRAQFQAGGKVLAIQNVFPQDQGVYECTAKSHLWKFSSHTSVMTRNTTPAKTSRS